MSMAKHSWGDVIALNLDGGVILSKAKAKAKAKNKDSASTPTPLSASRKQEILRVELLRSKFDEACDSYEAKRAVPVEMVAVPVEMVAVPVEMMAVPVEIKEPTLITCLMVLCKLETSRLRGSIQT